jgi:hypothetical protein
VSTETIDILVDGALAPVHRDSRATIGDGSERALSETMMRIAIVWGALAAALGAADAFSKGPFRRGGVLGLYVAAPPLAFAAVFAVSRRVRAWALAVDPRAIVLFNVIRFAGVAFLILYRQGQLAPGFALSAGWMDVIVGATAPLAAFYLTPTRTALRRGLLLAWMAFGIADFAISIPLGARARRADPASMIAVTKFPLSMIATFFVPLALIGYVISARSSGGSAGAGDVREESPELDWRVEECRLCA